VIVGRGEVGNEAHNERVSDERVGVIGDLNVSHVKTGGVRVCWSISAEVEHNFLAMFIHGLGRERLGLRQLGSHRGRALVEAKHDADCGGDGCQLVRWSEKRRGVVWCANLLGAVGS
jgi:hypothetical protein